MSSFIRTRKKFVSSAIASSLSMIATAAIAQDKENVVQLPTIHAEATAEQLKVDGMFSNILKNDRIAFKAAWKQADTFKKYMRAKNLKWRNKKIQKYGDKAIL